MSSDQFTNPPPEPGWVDDLVDRRIVCWFFIAALVYLGISMVAGLLVALQLVNWNPLNGWEILSAGRWRMVHTNAIAYGFLANAFLGALHWAVPRLTLHKVASQALSYFIFVAWQVVVVSTAAALVIGPSFQSMEWVATLTAQFGTSMSLGAQGVEWGETPFWIDPIALVGLLLVAINFMTPIAKAKGPLYVTLWYFMAA
ncbi:MAG: cbb3-type cytochrome c oxidase subunit I, partial [Pirellulales bacterium]|nr:cbb3-type cytochrome c oxidase subunit I [Pirellulales bacterium]